MAVYLCQALANIAGGVARLGIDDAPLFAHLERIERL